MLGVSEREATSFLPVTGESGLIALDPSRCLFMSGDSGLPALDPRLNAYILMWESRYPTLDPCLDEDVP